MKILSVFEFINIASGVLEQTLGTVCVQGEISNYRLVQDKMIYFTLKDDKAQILCFAMLWQLGQQLEDGLEVKIYGVPKLFKKRGEFYLSVQEVELVGEGALQRAYEELKKKLFREGVFAERYKKSLPVFPETIGLITAKGGAAYKDVLKRLNERWGGLVVYFLPVQVQGLGSTKQLIQALKFFNEQNPVDVLILTRGGGSLEDYQPFNDERLVRAVFASRLPIICGIGHEKDVCLAELAADRRASTPTNAAEIVIPHKREAAYQLQQMAAVLERSLDNLINNKRDAVSHEFASMEQIFNHKILFTREVVARFSRVAAVFGDKLKFHQQKIENSFVYLANNFSERLKKITTEVNHRLDLLKKLSPPATLARGYTITFKNGRIVKSAANLLVGDEIKTRFSDGQVVSMVQKLNG